ncbi:hypothetical protein C5167_023876 [Papaver somniferum]|uniref:Uncharacterized protein n=1 Tax=Papaver somniferum TaxID=3469 RepID=A0A4Y7JLW7_PAPSO|nr:hypothetical protein C5167_023876 [Papaver somniferum]
MTQLTSVSSSFSYFYGSFIGGLALVGCRREGSGGGGGGGCGNSRVEDFYCSWTIWQVVVEEIGDGVLVEKVIEVLLAEGMTDLNGFCSSEDFWKKGEKVGNYELKSRDYGEQDEDCCKDSLGDDLCLVEISSNDAALGTWRAQNSVKIL